MSFLSDEEKTLYSRHIMLEEVGEEGQYRLRNGRVLIIGAGGLGSPVALYLAAAGVGTIGIADGDCLELSNLQRQVIHGREDVGSLKAYSAQQRIRQLNPFCNVVAIPEMLDAAKLAMLLEQYDFVIDATDSLKAKMMINDICVSGRKPFSHGGILRFQGQTMTVIPEVTACYRCLFGELPPEEEHQACERDGVFGVLPGVIGSLQAAEALKFLTGIGKLLAGRLLVYDLLAARFREVTVPKDKECKACGLL